MGPDKIPLAMFYGMKTKLRGAKQYSKQGNPNGSESGPPHPTMASLTPHSLAM